MAVFSSRKVVVTRHEWAIPVGSTCAELMKAYAVASLAYREAHGMDRDADLWDDALWVTSDGEEVVIYFTTEAKAGETR